jgi:dolichol-phosphate mannosyltransferase
MASTTTDRHAEAGEPRIAVVVPMFNEADNVEPLVDEVAAALASLGPCELVVIDDGSTDDTAERLAAARGRVPWLRVLRHRRRSGQSAALVTGIKAARAGVIVTLDGDGQNDPADIPRLMAVFEGDAAPRTLMVAGHRASRRDPWIKRLSSRLANAVRAGLLGDATPDTGCGLKVFARPAFLDMPRFDHMHRFLPALMLRQGGRVVSVVVNHRPRGRGVSKYGTLDRLWVGLGDMLGVMWLKRRARLLTVETEEQG